MRALRALVVAAVVGVALAPPAHAVPSVERLAGATRYDTAAAVARALHPDGSPTAVVAAGTSWADALTAGVAAAALDAPLLLASAAYVPIDALHALHARDVILIGGTAALPDLVSDDLTAAGFAVRRIAGDDRFETAALVASATTADATRVVTVSGMSFEPALVAAVHAARLRSRLVLSARMPADEIAVDGDVLRGDASSLNAALLSRFPATADTAVVTTIDSFPDALSAAALAGALDAPVLFTRAASAGRLTTDVFRMIRPARLLVVGGPAAVPTLVLQQLFGWAALPPVIDPAAARAVALDVFARVNAERAARGVAPLVWDQSLADSAAAWAKEMSRSGYRNDALIGGLGENIHRPIPYCVDGACHHPTSGVLHRDWMHSTGHRDNVLEPGYVIAGVGVYCAPDGTLWAVERFGIGFHGMSSGGTAPDPIVRDDTSGITCEGKVVAAQPWWAAADS